ncbi:hypothetical protein [Novilysobacter erysipheiresistens]|uniref:Ferrous iron transport protein A n=1 Tax=Novilysobacter erysipheiresistens TaxID=1749332 RepID=A0ABU7YU83_9GAMM
MMSPVQVEAWNAAHPVGTLVEVRRAVGGTTYTARTASPLRLWGDWAIVELQAGGAVTLDRLRVVDQDFPTP